jgi:integrase
VKLQPRRPFLFNSEQARRLLEVVGQLLSNPRAQNRGETYRMIFALLYGLGLRVGEVSRLRRKDIDADTRFLTIRQTKFGKDRLVPFGPKMARAITGFLDREESLRADSSPTAPCSPSTSSHDGRLARTQSVRHSTNCCPLFS